MATTGPTVEASTRPESDVALLRLLIEAQNLDAAGVAEAANAALGKDWRGRDWVAAQLFPSAAADGDAALASFYELSGSVDAFRVEQIAWEITYRLKDTGAFDSVKPDLPTGTYQLDIDDEEEGIFGGKEVDLPETDAPNFTWALKNIRVPEAWELEPKPGGKRRGEGSVVGHPDTGYTNHPQVSLDALDRERDRDFVADPEDDDAEDPLDRASFPLETFPAHGTGTSSVIVGRGEGLLTGVAPMAILIPIRAVRSVVQVMDGQVAKAVDHARRMGAHVISMSLGGLGFHGLEAAIDRAVEEGVIVLAAAGNHLPGRFVCYPARYRNCLAVAASNARDGQWGGSSHGRAVAIAAPGTGVWVARWNLDARPPVPDKIGRSRGTSHAVAHVAGVAALWLAHHGRQSLLDRYGPENMSAAFRHVVRQTCRTPADWNTKKWGAGIIDAAALLSLDPLPSRDEIEAGEEAVEAEMTSLDVVLESVPDVENEVLVQRLTSLLGSGDEEAAGGDPSRDTLDRYSDELAYLMLEKREVRDALAGDWEAESAGPSGPQVMGRALRRTASKSLLQKMGLA